MSAAGLNPLGQFRPPLPDRVGALDGLRGWAALGVLLFHLTWELFGEVFPVYRSVFALLFTGGGGLAVCTFFVTSGYLLTIRRWYVDDDKRLIVQLFKRYVRLTVPIIASALIFWAVLATNLDFSEPASRIVERSTWLRPFGKANPDLVAAITFALWRNYIIDRAQNYGPFLWTMAIQWWGSLLTMPVAYGSKVLREPYSPLLLLVVVLLYLYPYLACIPLGALLALLERDGIVFRTPAKRLESAVATVSFFAIILISSALEDWKVRMILQVGLSLLFVAAAMRSAPLSRMFSSPLSLFFGRISFPVYLVQGAVLISLTSWLIIWVNDAAALNQWTALAIVAVSVAVTVVASWAFMPVEHLAVWLVRRIDGAGKGRPRPA